MKNKLFLLISLFILTNISIAKTPVEQVEAYIKTIDARYQDIAKSLVMLTYSQALAKVSDSQSTLNLLADYIPDISSESDGLKFIRLSEQIFEIVYNDKLTEEEKLNALVGIFVKLKLLKKKWLYSGVSIHSDNTTFFNQLNKSSNICSEKSFSTSMNVVNMAAPEGMDLGALNKAWSATASFTVNTDGQLSDYNSGLMVEKPDDEESKEAAASFAVGAAVATGVQMAVAAGVIKASMVQMMAVGAMGGPAVIGVAVAVILKLALDYSDLREARKGIEHLQEANYKLFDKMQMEKGVKEYYFEYCNAVNDSYISTVPLIKRLSIDEKAINDVQKQIQMHENYLKENGLFNNIADIDVSKSPEQFAHFFSWKNLTTALEIKNNKNLYNSSWSHVMSDYDALLESLKSILIQVIHVRHPRHFRSSEKKFITRMNRLEEFVNFKESFTNKLIMYFQAIGEKKMSYFIDMSALLEYFKQGKVTFSEEEINFLSTYSEIVENLKKVK